MSTVTEIRDAIWLLPAKEAWKLAHELRDHLDGLIARAREEHALGKTRPMDEIVRDE